MPSLRKRTWKSGKVTWDIRYNYQGGTKIHTIGETDRRTAEKIFHQFCNQHAEGIIEPEKLKPSTTSKSDTPTLTQLAEFTRSYALSNKSGQTLRREQDAFKALVAGLGDIKISVLTPAKVELYKAARLKTVSANTVNIEIRILNTSLRQAFSLGWVESKPQHQFKQIRISDSSPPDWLSEDEIKHLLSTEDRDFRNFLAFLLLTGCRRNEALGMTWEDVDTAQHQIVIRGEIGKMGKRRTLPIHETLDAFLQRMPGDHVGPMFSSFHPNQITMKFRRWARQLGMRKSVSLHTLRSTFACHLIRKGVNIYDVSKLLGHSSVRVTEKHYLTQDTQSAKSAVAKLTYVELPIIDEQPV
jgi:integrase